MSTNERQSLIPDLVAARDELRANLHTLNKLSIVSQPLVDQVTTMQKTINDSIPLVIGSLVRANKLLAEVGLEADDSSDDG